MASDCLDIKNIELWCPGWPETHSHVTFSHFWHFRNFSIYFTIFQYSNVFFQILHRISCLGMFSDCMYVKNIELWCPGAGVALSRHFFSFLTFSFFFLYFSLFFIIFQYCVIFQILHWISCLMMLSDCLDMKNIEKCIFIQWIRHVNFFDTHLRTMSQRFFHHSERIWTSRLQKPSLHHPNQMRKNTKYHNECIKYLKLEKTMKKIFKMSVFFENPN